MSRSLAGARPHRRWARTLVVALAVPLLLSAAGRAAHAAPPDPRRIHLANGGFDPLAEALPPQAERDRPAGKAPAEGFIVQFDGPIGEDQRRALEQLGVRIGGSLPVRALETVMNESQRARVEALPGVRWVGPYRRDWKLSEGVRARLARAEAEGPPGPISLRVSLFPGLDEAGVNALRRLGARVGHRAQARAFSLVDIDLPPGRLDALLALPEVRYVQAVPVRIFHGDRARAITGLAAVADDLFTSGLDPDLDGRDDSSGFQVKYGHTDGGFWSAYIPTSRPGSRAAGSPGRWVRTSPTAADTGPTRRGLLIGDGSDWATVPAVPPGSGAVSANRWRGVQPEAGPSTTCPSRTPPTTGTSSRPTVRKRAPSSSRNSWGLADDATGAPILDYDSSAALWDEGVWDADDDADRLAAAGGLLFAAGNANQLTFGVRARWVSAADLQLGRQRQHARHGQERDHHQRRRDRPGLWVRRQQPRRATSTSLASRGPVDPDVSGQGLFKPDLVAPGGSVILSTEARPARAAPRRLRASMTTTYCSDSGSSYRYEGGTSMACPVAAGAGGVLYQDLVVNHGIAAPAPSLVKALLVNGALAIEPSGSCHYSFRPTQDKNLPGLGSGAGPMTRSTAARARLPCATWTSRTR